MSTARASTLIRLPRSTLRDLKTLAAREGKSLNRVFIEMSRERLRRRHAMTLEEYRKDPIWEIGKHPWSSGLGDLAENHDFYLYGPVTYKDKGE